MGAQKPKKYKKHATGQPSYPVGNPYPSMSGHNGPRAAST